MIRTHLLAGVAAPCLLLAVPAGAQVRSIDATPEKGTDATIVVTGQRDPLKLNDQSQAGSRLGLTIRETPASVDVLTQDDLQVRGLRTARETFNDVVGAIAGNVPGNPAVVSLRGFAGNTVSILQDGMRVSASTVVQRDSNNWHYDRVEVLKGPASVLYGEGALAGVINKVARKPLLGESHLDTLLSVGSFDTVFAAAGINLPASSTFAVRADASYQRSDSLYDVDNNDTFSAGLTASALWKPSDRLSLLVAVDHFEDRYDATYQGLPLIPGQYALRPTDAVTAANGLVADRALRRRNYNPRGAYSGADETTVRSRLDWSISSGWTFALDLTGYTAKRAFLLADSQTFVAPIAAFPNGGFRQTYQDFRHDHQFWNARGVIGNDGAIAGLRNRFSLGAEHNDTDFVSLRRTAPTSALPAVDVRSPAIVPLPVGTAIFTAGNVTFDSKLKQTSVFAEDALNLTPRWLLVGGVRWDHIELDRTTIQNVGGAVDLSELVGGLRIDRSGNRPINVPSTTVNASALYTVADKVTLGGFLRRAGAFYTDTANTIRVAGHTLLDASLSVPVAPQATLTLRGRNLTDAFYGEYSGYPTTNVYIGAPRSFEVALATRF